MERQGIKLNLRKIGQGTKFMKDVSCFGASLVAQRLKRLPVSACNAGDLGSIPGSGRSPGEGNGNPLQYSCLENPVDGGAWWATVHGVTKSWTWLSNFTYGTLHLLSTYIITISKQPFIILCPFTVNWSTETLTFWPC